MTDETASTRARVLAAFNRLVFRHPGRRPPLAAVIAEAGIARSTLYDHFGGRDDLLLEALKDPLGVVADVAAGGGDADHLARVLTHFRERRKEAADLFAGPLQARILRVLAGQVRERDPDLSEPASLQLAGMVLGLVQLWLSGAAPSSAEDLARLLADTAAAQRGVLKSR
jgi:AcrR family transcriptional regulator